ncbi:hypothetical protein [uncultured Desulfovibrio sp.]|uniref:Uncharacterized protein n=1 Tax=Candidatus Desulfovibrio intestinavium TaxID=2838534 RepID=A0A9D2HNM5_9BACT|nr:hypothetical protein [uncultured Desulfovibrio sp.]HJA79532.1 hypothetical protein [Candidatus Desulfovibrio intestinavium]
MAIPELTTPVVDANQAILGFLGRKLDNGQELTGIENLMAMTASAKELRQDYGPTPADMQLEKPELPETVKGVLANYAGV